MTRIDVLVVALWVLVGLGALYTQITELESRVQDLERLAGVTQHQP